MPIAETRYGEIEETLSRLVAAIEAEASSFETGDCPDQTLETLAHAFGNLKRYTKDTGFSSLFYLSAKSELIVELLRTRPPGKLQDAYQWLSGVGRQMALWHKEIREKSTPSPLRQEVVQTPKLSVDDKRKGDLRKLKVLYVEDEPSVQKSFARYLSRRVGHLILAKDGQEGVELFHRHHPDLIITDINMPQLHGFHMLKSLQAKTAHVPVIITTAYSDQAFIEKASRQGIYSYFIKPFDYERLEVELVLLAQNRGR